MLKFIYEEIVWSNSDNVWDIINGNVKEKRDGRERRE